MERGLSHELVESVGIIYPQSATAHNSTEDGTGHQRLIKHLQHHLADVEKIEMGVFTPSDTAVHHTPLLNLLTLTDTSDESSENL